MAMLLGKKVGMTQVYDGDGVMTSVTVLQAGPCKVLQVKTSETDGYEAIQMGYDDKKESRIKKAEAGHAKKANAAAKRFVREWRLNGEDAGVEPGGDINVDSFEEVKFVDVIGTSKGKGFAGCMKRHNFGGYPASHGCKRKHRAPGAISSNASDAGHGGNLKKGKRMAGQMGNKRITSRNHQIISIDTERNLIVVKGSVPGPSGGYVEIRSSKKA